MGKKWTVYKHINKTNGKVYIGITCTSVTRRWCNGRGYKNSIYFYNAIKKYGWDGFDHHILAEELSQKEACNMEIDLIAKYKSMSRKFGYNCTYGGESNIPTLEARVKMSKNHANYKGENNPNWGKQTPLEVKEKLSKANKGKKPSDNTIKRAIEVNKGSKNSPETLLKKSIARMGEKNPNWGKTHSAGTRKKISENLPNFSGDKNPRARSVKCINTGDIFTTCKEASEWCGLINGLSHISACCRGKKKHIGKHPQTGERLSWMYYEEGA